MNYLGARVNDKDKGEQMELYTIRVMRTVDGTPAKSDKSVEVKLMAEFSYSDKKEAEANLVKFKEVLVAINAVEYGFSINWQ